MSEELNNQNNVEPEAEAPVVATPETPAPVETPVEPVETAEEPAVEPAPQAAPQPQVIVQRERGFAHYVGFALLCVLCIAFYFIPGIALTFAISLIPGISLGAVAAWTFSAIFSVIAWAIFKLKIKGIKKSFYFYIGLCVFVTILLIAIEILTEETNVFAKIVSLLCGAA
ncbi:hypothetical protein SAMN05720473_106133 [Fibrobacter sp. UWB15]|jgi:hypothetical protein|uniref:hypothetical protein n=1 Tax=unclassified Fibrobacter TaxID=2634177 RepID=UPI00091C0FB1|nr:MULTISPECIES: hypothetical protein [unclassified Fibrobacter]PWJ64594.1 hypothetical protein BGW99_105133 [Fibrobacter sp. UWB6]SHG18042.1 hypothetical protein SAMN05720760_105133 [Fibrobacter sp. UWB8]SMG33408.1 hypothetical protein SAMN05720473_106133 [Fibrobacter sp. UWB15]